MKIYFVNRFFFPDISATSQILTDAALYLSGKGSDVHVVTSRLRYEGGERLPGEEVVDGVQVHRLWSTGFGRAGLLGRAFDYLSFYFSVFIFLVRNLKDGDLAVAKTDPPLVSIPVGWAARLTGARSANWLQDLFPEVAEELGMRIPGFVTRVLRSFRDSSLRRAELNIVIGELMQERVVKLGVNPGSIRVIPNWSDLDMGASETPDCLRTEWQLDHKFVIGYSGNLGLAHETETLLGAMNQLRERADICFLFIGGGALMQQLRHEVERSDFPNVVFKPYQPRERLPESLRVPDVHVTILKPALEGLIVPSKIYGVLAAGKPTIFVGDPVGEVGRMVSTHELGVNVRQGDVKAFVDAVERLQNDAFRTKAGMNAKTYYANEHAGRRSLGQFSQLVVP